MTDVLPAPFTPPAPARLERAALQGLLDALVDLGYDVLGPTVRDAAIVYDVVRAVADLPVGWTDEQEAGRYRLRRRDDEAVFGFTVGPTSWKRFLFPPEARLWRARREDGALRFEPEPAPARPLALLGVRGCELAAIAVQDRVFLGAGVERDPVYAARREGALIVAVHCAVAGGTCFCVSMQTGPRAGPGWDLALTEVLGPKDAPDHHFVVEAGTPRGAEVLARLATRPASAPEQGAARTVVEATAGRMGRALDTTDLPARLLAGLEHPRWDDVATRCLSCANCTMVCPTCFCSAVEDTSDLTGEHAERWRRWDSCFGLEHSHLHGGSVRGSIRSRYRQWLTHKLATWVEQFGTSGCTGCGRCVTWCPVGIDLTEEARVIAGRAAAPAVGGGKTEGA